jgi:hypothetical protein
MNARKLLYVVLVLLPLTVSSLSLDLQTMSAIPDGNGSTLVDLGNGQFIEVGSDEVLHTYSLSDIPTEVLGTGDSLIGSESNQWCTILPLKQSLQRTSQYRSATIGKDTKYSPM